MVRDLTFDGLEFDMQSVLVATLSTTRQLSTQARAACADAAIASGNVVNSCSCFFAAVVKIRASATSPV